MTRPTIRSLRTSIAAVGATAVLAAGPVLATAPAQAAPHPTTPAVVLVVPAQDPSTEATKAVGYLAKNAVKGSTKDAGLLADSITGMIAAGATTDQVAPLLTALEKAAPTYVGKDPIKAAKVSLAVSATCGDPASFAGLDLPALITAGVGEKGQIGGFGDAYLQASAITALARAKADVPADAVSFLQSFADPKGSGGSGSPDMKDAKKFVTNPDYTAMATTALSLVQDAPGAADARTKAIAWATQNQQTDGSWLGYSPANSTGLMVATLADAGEDVTSGTAWLAKHQLADGGFAATAKGTKADLRATTQAALGLGGHTVATAAGEACAAPAATAQPTAGDESQTASPAEPGASSSSPTGWIVGGIVALLAIVGGAWAFLRRKAA